ncbi:hypothetical protein Tco_0517728 [Tanacetum coccineum]
MCDKKNSVLFTDTECVVLSSEFKLTDENHILLKVPRKNNMYSVDLKDIIPSGGYSTNSKAFRVFNSRTRIVKENMHVKFSKETPNIVPKKTLMQVQWILLMMDSNHQERLDEVQLDNKLHFIEEPVEIMDREVKRLKQSRIPIVKVRWNSRRGPEFTWEREDFFRSKYPHLFARRRVTRQDKRRDVAS